SLDRARDEGRLSAHHLFWEVEQGSHRVDAAEHSMRTVTEMIYVPNHLPDGRYFLDIQLAPFVADAAPSRPILFSIDTEQHS
ncbi:MAG: cyclase family protein, partial [Bacteroidota bacterium]|nr:cyclase family protein [Bacteroidota bacterium]